MLADSNPHARLRRDGYATLPVLNGDQIRALERVFYACYGEAPPAFFSTSLDENHPRRSRIDREIKEIAGSLIKGILPGYEVRMASFVAKGPGQESKVDLHQDYWFADYRKDLAFNVWIPLVDVDTTNGCLKVVEGSHSVFQSIVPTMCPTPYEHLRAVIESEFMVPVPLKAGEAIVFDGRLMHGSYANLSNEVRLAMSCVILPASVPLRVYKWTQEQASILEVLEACDEAMSDWDYRVGFEEPYPEGVSHVETLDFAITPVELKELEKLRPERRVKEGL